MELEGFEPSSKQAIHKISTCLFCYSFSSKIREQTPKFYLNFFSFRSWAKVSQDLFPHCYTSESDVAKQNFCEISCFLTIFGKTQILLNFRLCCKSELLVASYSYVARDLRDRATVLCMLTYPLILLSKPVNPNFLSMQI